MKKLSNDEGTLHEFHTSRCARVRRLLKYIIVNTPPTLFLSTHRKLVLTVSHDTSTRTVKTNNQPTMIGNKI